MRLNKLQKLSLAGLALGLGFMFGCGAPPVTNTTNTGNRAANTNAANASNANTIASNADAVTSAPVETKEPEVYQATVTLRLESVGGQQNTALPTITANVARSGDSRRMEFTMPAGGRVVFLDKGGVNYLILPEKRQYAELNRDSLGFDVRRMLTPEQIVEQVKAVRGVERVGEETYNGRTVIKYRYAATANTQTRAGRVATESFLLVDKETGLPLRSETVSQSQSGSVQGVGGMRAITEITDLKTEAPPTMFDAPTDMQKIESSQIRGQVELVFNSLVAALGQMMKQVQPAQ